MRASGPVRFGRVCQNRCKLGHDSACTHLAAPLPSLRLRRAAQDADGRLRIFPRVRRLSDAGSSEGRRLLCVLLVWVCTVPTPPGRQRLLRYTG